jgi:hypothetical protein
MDLLESIGSYDEDAAMLNDVISTVASFNCVPKRRVAVVSCYLFFLTLITKRHSFRQAARVTGLHESRFCALLNDATTRELSQDVFNRSLRRYLKKLRKKKDGRVVIIIDATIKRRRSKEVENVARYHHGSGTVLGTKFINFVLLSPKGVVPIETIPLYTKKYCRENKKRYRTENEIVQDWIVSLEEKQMLSKEQLKSVLFLLDAGYDDKDIQKSIKGIGANFVVAIKKNRSVAGKQVAELFRCNRRWFPSVSIRLTVGSGGKGSRRRYSIRTATKVNLKGVGPVTVVCSKAQSRAKKPLKYLATSDLALTGRQIVDWYSQRWTIETWHRKMKQDYGFIDCHSTRFSAIEAHVNFSLTAYVLQREKNRDQIPVENYVCLKEMNRLKRELSKFGALKHAQTLVNAVSKRFAA